MQTQNASANANRPESPKRRRVLERLKTSKAYPLLVLPRSQPFPKNLQDPTRMITNSPHPTATALKFTNQWQPPEAEKSHDRPHPSNQSVSKTIAAAHHPRVTRRLRSHARPCSPRVPPATSTAHKVCRTSQLPDPRSGATRAYAQLLPHHCTARSRPLPVRRLVRLAPDTRLRKRIRVIRGTCRTIDRGLGTTLPAATAKR
jgi:hypothetical protein